MSANFKENPSHAGEPQVLRLEGLLDHESATTLSSSLEGLIERGFVHIALDFTRVDMVSSSAVRVLLEKTKMLQSKGGKLVLFSVHIEVVEMLKLAGYEKILNIFPLEGEALSALNS